VARTLAAPYLKDMFESVRGRVQKRWPSTNWREGMTGSSRGR